MGRAWSLSEIEFGERKINNLRKCSGAQVIDSSFEKSYLRQTPCPAGFHAFRCQPTVPSASLATLAVLEWMVTVSSTRIAYPPASTIATAGKKPGTDGTFP